MHLVDGTLVLSATDLTGFLACEHLTELDRAVAQGLLPAPVRHDPELEVLRRRGEEHELHHLDALRAEGRSVVEIPRGEYTLDGLRDWEALALAAMRDGADVIYQAAFFDGRWHGRADFLIRVDEPSDLGAWSYEVADTKLARSLKASALLQTAEYSLHVERLQGRAPRHLHIVLGNGERETRFVADVVSYHRAARRRLEEVVGGGPRPTYPDRVEHCRVCRWVDGCELRRRADDHLSLVAGMRRDQIHRLEAAGVGTLEGLATALPLVPRLSEETLANLHAQAALQLRQRADGVMRHELRAREEGRRGLAALPEPSPADLFFDMEGDPWAEETGLEYLFGITEVVAGEPRHHAFWGHDRIGEKRAFETLVDFVVERLDRDPALHVYHYAAYELTALRRLAGRHATREDEVDRLLRGEVLVDLYRVVREGVRVSAESYGLKSLEPLFMPKRTGAITDGGSSIAEYERWLESRDPAILEAIAEYNAADCESTWRLRGWLEERRAELEAASGAPSPRPEPGDGAPSEEVARDSEEARELAGRLRARATGGAEADAATGLLADLIDWHRREDRPAWWAYFARLAMGEEQLFEDPDSIAGLRFDDVVGVEKSSGKTHSAARMILDLVGRGRRVGITAMSHRAIGNLLDEVCRQAAEAGLQLTAVQKVNQHQRCRSDAVQAVDSVAKVVASLARGADVVAGTAWLFADLGMEGALDTLVVDEAGRSRSPLDATWRMHPAVCAFVSEAFYDGRLASRPECAGQAVCAPPPLGGAGVRYLPVLHMGNRVTSPEEVEVVRDTVETLLTRGRWTDRHGADRPIRLDDVLVVAPYNAHVNRLQDALGPAARVGTVDRFQGQEAPIVIYTMATSSGEDQRRSMDFLFSLNRLNVAVSRAQGMAVLVCSPALLGVHCRTAEQLILANALCRLVEMAGTSETGGDTLMSPPPGIVVLSAPSSGGGLHEQEDSE